MNLSTYIRILFLAFLLCPTNVHTQSTIGEAKVAYQDALSSNDKAKALTAISKVLNLSYAQGKMDSVISYLKIQKSLAKELKNKSIFLEASNNYISSQNLINGFIANEGEILRQLTPYLNDDDIDPIIRAESHTILSQYHFRKGHQDSCLQNIDKAVELGENNVDYYFGNNVQKAAYLNSFGKRIEAIEILLDQEKRLLDQDLDDLKLIKVYQSLGRVLYESFDPDKAIYYNQKALALCEKNNYKSYIALCHLRMGSCYQMKDNHKSSKDYFYKALGYYKNSKRYEVISDLYSNIAFTELKENNYETAGYLLDSMYNTLNLIPNSNDAMLVEYYILSANRALGLKKYAEAKSFLDKAEPLKEMYNVDDGDYEFIQYHYYKAIGQDKMALEFYEKYKEKETKKENKKQNSAIQQLEFEFNRKNQDIAIENLNAITDAQTRALEIRNIALVGGTILILALLGLLYGLYRLFSKYRSNQKELAKQNELVTRALNLNKNLLKEIHHRVKNNLQVISSLLSMQARKVTDEGTKDALNSSKTRVQSMSILHQNLYQKDDLTGVNVDEYLKDLIDNIMETYKTRDAIEVRSNIDAISIDVDNLVPLGLVANELICNALKHAYSDGKPGTLDVNLKEIGDKIVFEVRDSGTEFKGDKLPIKEGSLGAKLINSFVQRLEAKLIVDTTSGTCVTVEMNKKSLGID